MEPERRNDRGRRGTGARYAFWVARGVGVGRDISSGSSTPRTVRGCGILANLTIVIVCCGKPDLILVTNLIKLLERATN
jgi:hypothetical protein